MYISVDWISEYVDLDGISAEDLAERITIHTAEVEGVETLNRAVADALVVDVLSCFAIDTGTKTVHVVELDAGGRRYRTVCGAPNVRAGIRAVFVPAGGAVAGGKTLEDTELYGHPSEGMLCSAAELGMGTAHESIVEVPGSIPAGTPLASLVPATDTLIEIDNKSLTHRPDLWGHHGFAREVAAIFGRALRPLDTTDLDAFADLPPVPVTVADHGDCPVYTAIAIDVSGDQPSSLTVQRRLLALGTSPRSALVDLTNYVQLELGQPTHAFDARKVSAVRVGPAGKTQSFTTLDGKSWALEPDDLLIHNADEPVALAGIMGGLHSKVEPDTTQLLLESANFRGARVRTTASRLNLRTDSSLRFEKKQPPANARLAAARITRLLETEGLSPKVRSRLTVVGDLHDSPRMLNVPAGYLTRRAGVDISDARALSILTSLGFGCTILPGGGLDVAIPSFRGLRDIAILEDISEEVMRIYGYDQMEPVLPAAPMRSTDNDKGTQNAHRLRRLLAGGHRFHELHTYSWTDDEWLSTIGFEPGATLNLTNPIAAGRGRMRTTQLPNILGVARDNRRVRDDFRIFELGRTFWLGAQGDKHEADELAGLSVVQSDAQNEELHFRQIRGAMDDIAAVTGLPPFSYRRVKTPPDAPWFAPGLALEILKNDVVIGHMGVIPRELRTKVLDRGHGVWFRLEMPALMGEGFPEQPYVAPFVYPGSTQDFTFSWPVVDGYEALADVINAHSSPLLARWELVDFYRPMVSKKKAAPNGNYSFRFHLQLEDRTLTADDIEAFRTSFLAHAQAHALQQT